MSFLVYPPPRYHGVHGDVSARYRPVDTAPDLVSGGGDAGDVTGASAQQRLHYLATGAGTGGEFGLYRIDMPPHGMGPKTHFHRTMTESFFILSGSVALSTASAGSTPHRATSSTCPSVACTPFRNATDEPASMLLLFTPAPRASRTSRASPTSRRCLDDERQASSCGTTTTGSDRPYRGVTAPPGTVHEGHGHRALADGRRDPLDRLGTDVPGHEHPGHARLQVVRVPVQRPARRAACPRSQVRAGADEAARVADHDAVQPLGPRCGADEDEQRAAVDGLLLTGLGVAQHEPLEVLVALRLDDLGPGPDADVLDVRRAA